MWSRKRNTTKPSSKPNSSSKRTLTVTPRRTRESPPTLNESWLKEATSSPERGNATFDRGVDLINSGGEFTDNMVNEFAQAQKLTPAEARARATHVMASYSAEAARAVEKETGIPASVAAKALNEARSDSGLQRLAMDHFTSGRG